MTSNWIKFDLVLSTLFGIAIGFISSFYIYRCHHNQQKSKDDDDDDDDHDETLHWNPLVERRGLGDLLTRLNHIAITVSDVGKSLSFYVDILGFQQIRRPNFDRHGAWLTMGNVELHLIKGIPAIPSMDNLQVTHLAFETTDIDEVLYKLNELNIDVRQGLSVTNAHKTMTKEDKPVIIQYFFNDPDGYYIELCNCHVLTQFSFSHNLIIDDIKYHEGVHNKKVFIVVQAMTHWRRKIQRHTNEQLDEIVKSIIRASEVDEMKFNNLVKRRLIYGDIIQGCSDEDVREALLQANNFVPLTMKILARKRGERRYFRPPSFIEHGEIIEPDPFIMDTNKSNYR